MTVPQMVLDEEAHMLQEAYDTELTELEGEMDYRLQVEAGLPVYVKLYVEVRYDAGNGYNTSNYETGNFNHE